MTADDGDLATIEAEALRLGVSMAELMREAVREAANRIRERRRPRVGVARSTDGRAAADVTREPIARPPS